MTTKSCSQCGHPADFSVCCLVSTVGQSPRTQKCSSSVLLCQACIRAWDVQSEPVSLSSLIQSLRAAYTALTRPPAERSGSPKDGEA